MYAGALLFLVVALLVSYTWEHPNHVAYGFLAWMGLRALR